MTPAEYLIHVFKGVRACAREVRRTPGAVSRWKNRGKGRVPSGVHLAALAAARRKKLDLTEKDLIHGRNVR